MKCNRSVRGADTYLQELVGNCAYEIATIDNYKTRAYRFKFFGIYNWLF